MMNDDQNDNVREMIITHLASKHLFPTTTWLNEFMQQCGSFPPSSIHHTAVFRYLQTDLTTTSQRSVEKLPAGIADPQVVEQRIPGPIVVQLLDIEDIGSSVWSRLEAIEAQERGETTRGNQVIRVLPDENNETIKTSSGPHKVLLQDVAGTKVYALETKSISGFDTKTSIGMKLVLENIVVARGVMLLEPSNVVLLNGKIEELDKAWRAGLKAKLKSKITVDGV